ncbi:GNAT family N-acetyltransferase [uncultured Algibacter sp.]|uniref:GNAT family N-acetyltransferase n=1 Tax=uncultured Algibacter sp. TaxID=298659 RepID=UPI0026275B21|nr:GNAT family N-acetyltransferase [uncultured Algibacter sp.]
MDDLPVGYAKLINDFLNRKIGYLLQNEIFEEAKRIESNHLWLSVYVDNPKVIRFYERYGYHKLGTHIFGILN